MLRIEMRFASSLSPQIQDFSTLTDSVFTLLRTILGDFDFPAMNKAEPVLGPLFFMGYVLSIFFVLLVRLWLFWLSDRHSTLSCFNIQCLMMVRISQICT